MKQIRYKNLDRDFVIRAVEVSTSIVDFSKRIGCNSRDGIRLSRLRELEKALNISIVEPLRKQRRDKLNKQVNARLDKIYICSNCGNTCTERQHHQTSRSGNHFCSKKCAKQFAAKFANTKEIRKQKALILKQAVIQRYIPKICPECGNEIPFERRKRKTCSDICASKYRSKILSQVLKGRTGGFHERSSNGKRGWYKGFYCASTYELAFVIYCLDHNIKIERNKKAYEYQWEGKTYKYYPDWIVNGDHYVETKNFITDRVLAKAAAVKDMPIEIIDKNGIDPYCKYVAETYHLKYYRSSNEFWKLYDKQDDII